jgi:hypothetical protein
MRKRNHWAFWNATGDSVPILTPHSKSGIMEV